MDWLSLYHLLDDARPEINDTTVLMHVYEIQKYAALRILIEEESE